MNIGKCSIIFLLFCVFGSILSRAIRKRHPEGKLVIRDCKRYLIMYSRTICKEKCEKFDDLLVEGCHSNQTLSNERTRELCCPNAGSN
ncbi:INSulin related [Caenorhabditis elegans]|uniref:INSulin related n=1 Tax=Caenorhabditis elegans TaxID=6239 RepID=G2HK14_CAEEL|nr:INSulin related [Caenorhabditis elegans]CCD31147.1 INSulin related [Caenorhabditis elegans]|eukprot:NP_001251579.1 INSulin related [Caenorhabditis elegans]